jgi:cob(I)alamin adenosyltransferase
VGVYTKTGDAGKTSLYTGERLDKASLRVETYGTVDEINSALGMARVFCKNMEVQEQILASQKSVSLLMADLASLGKDSYITMEQVGKMEKAIDSMESRLPVLKKFIIPGNTQGGAMLDLARTITRRAERMVLHLAQTEEVHEADRIFLNRLSDFCFTLMRLEESGI